MPERTRRRGRRQAEPSPNAARKVIVEFPSELLQRAERVAAELDTDRSKLIRSAVESYLELVHRKRLELELAQGYSANSKMDRELCRDFGHVDAETL